MFDDILSSYGDNNPQQDLVDKAAAIGVTLDPDHTQFKYMDLVDSTSDNAWVSASQRITVFWPYPEGTDQNTPFTLLRYDGVNRQYGLGGDESYQDQMQTVTVTQLTQEEKSATVQQLEHGLLLTIGEFTPTAYALSWQPTVSVDVTWGSLSYTYNPGTWNPDTHQYDGRGWTADQEGGDQITLVNQGAADVAITAGYTAEENYTSGGTFQVDGVSVNGSQSLPAATDGTPSSLIFTFLPTGDPVAQQFEDQKIGTITMTIGDVS